MILRARVAMAELMDVCAAAAPRPEADRHPQRWPGKSAGRVHKATYVELSVAAELPGAQHANSTGMLGLRWDDILRRKLYCPFW